MTDSAAKPAGLAILENFSRDGVWFGGFRLNGRAWRVGSLWPDWPDRLTELPCDPGPGAVDRLAAAGVWLGAADSPCGQLALMCCGLGSVWPGMGKGLYEAFPVAAAAMERIASLADWDILGLMDESGLEKISLSRWQIPYLFMLEYAQHEVFRSLGLKPDVICGHSLGELIALCFAGIYDVRGAWHLLETRAVHVAELEARSGRQGGMLAVPADFAVIDATLKEWPDLRISNRNTPRQYILSGRRDQLLEARRHLRRQRVPAVMLNMDLAFHNPAMRVLREISITRMEGLDMCGRHGGRMLSCVSGLPYPDNQPDICRAIADLDENMVDWVGLMESIGAKAGTFLELGPQETLCGITQELVPDPVCIAADRKGAEIVAMREACARLYAAGFLGRMAPESGLSPGRGYRAEQAADAVAHDLTDVPEKDRQTVLGLIADVCRRDIAEITPGLDLRRDLCLRSSGFPFLMMEAEQRLGRPVSLDNLFQITTVADLVRFLAGAPSGTSARGSAPVRREFALGRSPLSRWRVVDGALSSAPLNPGATGIVDEHGAKVVASLHDVDSAGRIRSALKFAGILSPDGQDSVGRTCVIIVPPARNAAGPAGAAWADAEHIALAAGCRPDERLVVLQRFTISGATDWQGAVVAWLEKARAALKDRRAPFRLIAWVTANLPLQNPDYGDQLIWELLRSEDEAVVWTSLPEVPAVPRFYPGSSCYDDVAPAVPVPADGSIFQGFCQFSLFTRPDLAAHGANAAFSPLMQEEGPFRNVAWLPLGEILAALFQVAAVNSPWLELNGLHDLQVCRFPALPEGITRECRIAASRHLELPFNRAMMRNFKAELSVAALTANGRKTGSWLPAAGCAFMLNRDPPEFPIDGNFGALPAPPGVGGNAAAFYETMAFGPAWRFIEDISLNDGGGFYARLAPRCRSSVFLLLDAVWQTVTAANWLAESGNLRGLLNWKFHGMRYARFRPERIRQAEKLLFVGKTVWRDEKLLRYNVELYSQSRELLMTVTSLEFEYWTEGKI